MRGILAAGSAFSPVAASSQRARDGCDCHLSSRCFPECFAGALTAGQAHAGVSLWGSFFILSRPVLLHMSEGCVSAGAWHVRT